MKLAEGPQLFETTVSAVKVEQRRESFMGSPQIHSGVPSHSKAGL